MDLNLTFLGGAGTVTGSKHLLTVGTKKILIDCGLFQGIKEQRIQNWSPLPIDPRTIDSVILTHAHLDHTGYLPLLVKQGFKGMIYCSKPTAALTKLVLLDAAKIQEEDAEHANQNHYSKHHPALPLFRTSDAEAVFPLLRTFSNDQWHAIIPGLVDARFSQSGHILGSTFIEIRACGQLIVFSGDLGRNKPLTLKRRKSVLEADFLVVESTYGDRNHSKESPINSIEKTVNETIAREGQVLIPSFAIGRTQDILYVLSKLKASKRIPEVPIYLDSPMAAKATEIFSEFSDWHGLSTEELRDLNQAFQRVDSSEESAALCRSGAPAIVLAGSGMLSGGRIKRHLLARLPDSRNTVVLVGFQAAGTLGRFLREGAQETKMFGVYIPVRAAIAEISTLSAHADQSEILEWISEFSRPPKKIFIVHGEPHASEGLRVRIADRFAIPTHIAHLGDQCELV